MAGEALAATSRAGGAAHPVRHDLVELLKLAGPLVPARLGIMIMGFTDAVVVGRYSAVQLGYHALGWAVTSVVMGSAIGLLSGVQVMGSRALGEGRPREAGAALRRGLSYALWIGFGSTALVVIGGPTVLQSLGLAGDLAAGASRPLIVFALSMPVFMLSVASSSWLEGIKRPVPPLVIMWIANLVNLAVDLVLVPGAFGLPALGAVGGGIATFTARTVIAGGNLAYIWRMKDARELGVFDKPPRDRAREREQRRVGYGAGSSSFFEIMAFSGMNVVAGWIGGLAVAAWAVVLNVIAIVFMIPLGLATATAVLVARAHGARDEAGIDRAALVGYGVTAVFAAVATVIVWAFARQIAQVYTSEPSTVAMATAALLLSCVFLIPDALQVVVAQSLRARGDVLVPTITHMASYLLVMLPLAWWLSIPRHMGLQGIVWASVVATFVAAGLLLGRFWMLARRGEG
ncbi:MATE family efflux transporter [Caulobacter sp. KR2-114]|uniref:MATE family efflux transporter n=1 Tax=Caulobacter sp. KR2-114 TaxID=3400912 RepID=UPI003C10723B